MDQVGMEVRADGGLALAAGVAELLFVNGQTSEGTRIAVERLARACGRPVRFMARYGELTLQTDPRGFGAQVAAEPLGVDIRRVTATEQIVDDVCDGRLSRDDACAKLEAVRRLPPVSILRFGVMAGLGAGALGVIFGAADALTLSVIVASAALGACLRRGLASRSRNPFAQPLLAALAAGAIGSAATGLGWPVSHRLVAVCPCMILVPGPHFLNGAIDLARARIPLGAGRIALAILVVVAISAGLLAGLSITATGLPADGPAAPLPLAYDVGAAGIAVAAYGSFFNMAWRMLPLPIVVGMLAHALRWELLRTGASLQSGAFVACLLVGTATTLYAHRLRLPFGASAFAAVVSLIPGVFMFQTASDALALIDGGSAVSPSLLLAGLRDGATASIVLLAMAAGLIIPKLGLDHVLGRRPDGSGRRST